MIEMSHSVYVLIAREDDKVKECVVVDELIEATKLYDLIRKIYGGANCSMHSRGVNKIPSNLERALAESEMTPDQRKVWNGPVMGGLRHG